MSYTRNTHTRDTVCLPCRYIAIYCSTTTTLVYYNSTTTDAVALLLANIFYASDEESSTHTHTRSIVAADKQYTLYGKSMYAYIHTYIRSLLYQRTHGFERTNKHTPTVSAAYSCNERFLRCGWNLYKVQ